MAKEKKNTVVAQETGPQKPEADIVEEVQETDPQKTEADTVEEVEETDPQKTEADIVEEVQETLSKSERIKRAAQADLDRWNEESQKRCSPPEEEEDSE